MSTVACVSLTYLQIELQVSRQGGAAGSVSGCGSRQQACESASGYGASISERRVDTEKCRCKTRADAAFSSCLWLPRTKYPGQMRSRVALQQRMASPRCQSSFVKPRTRLLRLRRLPELPQSTLMRNQMQKARLQAGEESGPKTWMDGRMDAQTVRKQRERERETHKLGVYEQVHMYKHTHTHTPTHL